MTSRTRRRVLLSVILAAITLPIEGLILPVARTPDAGQAAVEWARNLPNVTLVSASARIEDYPVAYRRAIMVALDSTDRADAWRGHLRRYLAHHRELSVEQAAIIDDAIELLTPESLSTEISQATRNDIAAVFNRALTSLGPAVANELFVTLGPKDGGRPDVLPLRQRLADRVRSWRSVSASQSDCNCNIDIDTCDLEPDPWLQCSELYSCNFDLTWPMCGPFWSWACTGWCKVIRPPM
jgi:hypothetical protein